MSNLPPVLVVDDQLNNRIRFSISLRNFYYVETADSAESAIKLFRRRQAEEVPYKAILADYLMPQGDGIKLLANVRALDTEISVVMISAHGTILSASQAMRLEAFDYLDEMCARETLLETMAQAVGKTDARRAEAKNRSRGQAAEELVHDLASPLSTISIVSSLMPKSSENRHADTLRQEAQRLSELMHAWHAQIKNGTYHLKWNTPRTIIGNLVERIVPDLQGVRLQMTPVSELCEISVDEAQLLRVIENLVRNGAYAVLQSEGGLAGGIRITDEVREGQYYLVVQDTGVGIPKETLERVFERGFSTKGAFGSGLGLYICHKIVRDFGGDLTINSRPGLGTTVTMSLPCRANRAISRFPVAA